MNLLSGYHATPPLLVSPLQAMKAALGATNVEYAVGCNMTNISWGGIGGGTNGHAPHGVPPHQGVSVAEAQAHIEAAVAHAKKSDIVVIGLGLLCDNYGLTAGENWVIRKARILLALVSPAVTQRSICVSINCLDYFLDRRFWLTASRRQRRRTGSRWGSRVCRCRCSRPWLPRARLSSFSS